MNGKQASSSGKTKPAFKKQKLAEPAPIPIVDCTDSHPEPVPESDAVPTLKALAQAALSKKRLLEKTKFVKPVPDSQPPETPIKLNGSKIDREFRNTLSWSASLSDDSENSAEAQDRMLREEEYIQIFRQRCDAWLLDHGKHYFHVEALAWMRAQQVKQKDPLSTIGPQMGFGHAGPQAKTNRFK